MIDKVQFGKRNALLRKRLCLSQSELAEKLNISSQAVSKWECGQALPNLDLLVELSWLYETSINYLLEEGGNLINDKISERVMPPDDIEIFLNDKTQRNLISSIRC